MSEVRGSTHLLARLFETEPTDKELTAALNAAREEYRVLRWWKYGQPAVDSIKAQLDVSPERLGSVIEGLLHMHGDQVQITVHVFPYGIPALDGAHLGLLMERQIVR